MSSSFYHLSIISHKPTSVFFLFLVCTVNFHSFCLDLLFKMFPFRLALIDTTKIIQYNCSFIICLLLLVMSSAPRFVEINTVGSHYIWHWKIYHKTYIQHIINASASNFLGREMALTFFLHMAGVLKECFYNESSRGRKASSHLISWPPSYDTHIPMRIHTQVSLYNWNVKLNVNWTFFKLIFMF